ncbi:MAG: carbohydrate ABC transporter permease [Neobacillus sp.]
MKFGRYKRWEISGHLILGTMSFLAIIPFILLIISSFSNEQTVVRNGYSFFPEKFSIAAYQYIFNQWEVIGSGYLVTIIVTCVGTFIGVSISALIGWTLSRKSLPGRNFILFFVTFTMMFSGGLTAQYLIYTQIFQLKNTIFGLIVPNLMMNGFFVMTFRNYFEHHIPGTLLEAAKMDGASEVKSFFKIVLPLSAPIIITIGLPQALMYWNDWMNGMYYLSPGSKLQSIQTILNNINENIKFLQDNNLGSAGGQMSTAELPSTTIRMAMAVVGVLPIICVFPFLQKWLVKGITEGAVKG